MKKFIYLILFAFISITANSQNPAYHKNGVVIGDPSGTSADPESLEIANVSSIYWNSTLAKFRKWNGSSWSDLVSAGAVTVLAPLDEGNGIGYIVSGRDSDNYGNVGSKAFDLSYSDQTSTVWGATGEYSTAFGYKVVADGLFSSAFGNLSYAYGFNSLSTSGGVTIGSYTTAHGKDSQAIGDYSIALGRGVYAHSYGEISIGVYGTNYTPNSTNSFSTTDRLFVIGNSGTPATRSDAFTILKNGDTGIGIDNFESNTTGDLLQVNGSVYADGYKTPSGTANDVLLANGGTASLSGIADNSRYIQIALSDLTTDITTGETKGYFRMPYQATFVSAKVSLIDAGTVTGLSVDILENGTTTLSTLLTTDATEETSITATIPLVISDTTLTNDSKITFDFSVVPTSGLGVIITLELIKI